MRPRTSSTSSSSNQRSLFQSSNENRRKRDEATLQQMGDVTSKYLKKMEEDSSFFFGDSSGNSEANATSGIVVPRLEPSEIVLETTIGMGEFGVVLKVGTIELNNTSNHRNLHNKPDEVERKEGIECQLPEPVSSDEPVLWLSSEKNHSENVETDRILRKELAEMCRRSNIHGSTATTSNESSSDKNYCDSLSLSQASTSIELAPMSSYDIPANLLVIKQIRKDLYPKKRIEAAKDLAREAKLLARLQQLHGEHPYYHHSNTAHRNNHPNIISLRGIISHPGTPQFGILLDRLHLTLTELSTSWKKRQELILESLANDSSRKRSGASSLFSLARVIPDQVIGTMIGVSQKVGGLLRAEIQDHSTSDGSETEGSEECRAGEAVTKRASPEALLLLGERILALWDVSEGMAHLHYHKILYRDLKTENVGRTVRSKVKDDNGASPMFQNFDHRDQQRMQIFDFGLAKECKPTDRVSQYPTGRDSHYTDSADADSFYDTYKMTGMTGTMRIMAPEVIKCLAYGLPVDVYSFGICIWEIFTGTKCNFLSAAEICDTKHTVRPKLPEAFDTTENGSVGMPKKLQRLMQACWHENPGKRPSFCEISKILRSSLAELYRQSLGPQEQQKQQPRQELQGNRTSPFLSKGINEGCNEIGASLLWKNIHKPQKQKQQQQQQEWHTTLDGGLRNADLLSDQAGFWYRLEAIHASGLLDD